MLSSGLRDKMTFCKSVKCQLLARTKVSLDNSELFWALAFRSAVTISLILGRKENNSRNKSIPHPTPIFLYWYQVEFLKVLNIFPFL